MQELKAQEIDLVAGGDETDANRFAAAVMIGAAVGFLWGGPVGAVAGAVSAGGHAILISAVD